MSVKEQVAQYRKQDLLAGTKASPNGFFRGNQKMKGIRLSEEFIAEWNNEKVLLTEVMPTPEKELIVDVVDEPLQVVIEEVIEEVVEEVVEEIVSPKKKSRRKKK
jgi:hypothetical protein